MKAAQQGFWLPKAGNSDSDYEDAFAVGPDRIAIADGATESSFARAWAEALVEGFAAQDSANATEASIRQLGRPRWSVKALQEQIAPLQQAWHERIAWERLPWFAEDKARSGAFATLLVFQFVPPMNKEKEDPAANGSAADPAPDSELHSEFRWEALAIGDSCLFQIREDTLQAAFPLEQAEQFNSRPRLLSSNPSSNDTVWETIVVSGGDYQPGDTFLFATDALAHWILAEYEAGGRPWRSLCALRSQADFEALVARLRQEHAMRNDDVTLVRVSAPSDDDHSPSEATSVATNATEEAPANRDAGAVEPVTGPAIGIPALFQADSHEEPMLSPGEQESVRNPEEGI